MLATTIPGARGRGHLHEKDTIAQDLIVFGMDHDLDGGKPDFEPNAWAARLVETDEVEAGSIDDLALQVSGRPRDGACVRQLKYFGQGSEAGLSIGKDATTMNPGGDQPGIARLAPCPNGDGAVRLRRRPMPRNQSRPGAADRRVGLRPQGRRQHQRRLLLPNRGGIGGP